MSGYPGRFRKRSASFHQAKVKGLIGNAESSSILESQHSDEEIMS